MREGPGPCLLRSLLLIGWCKPRVGLGVPGEAAAEVTPDSRKILRMVSEIPDSGFHVVQSHPVGPGPKTLALSKGTWL